MYDPTDISEEINRKTSEALIGIVGKYQNGEISDQQYKAAVEAVWNVSSGLTKPEISALVDEALNQLPAKPQKRCYAWMTAKGVVLATWVYGTNVVTVSSIANGQKTQNQIKSASPHGASVFFDGVITALRQRYGAEIFGDDCDSWA